MTEIVKAEHVHCFGEYEEEYQFKVELLEVEKVMVEIFNSQSGVKYRTYLNKTDNWWEENSLKFQNDFSKVYSIINSSIFKEKECLKYELKEKNEIMFLKIMYINDMFPFDITIKIQRLISKNGLTDEKINVLEYQVAMMRDTLSKVNKRNSNKSSIPDGDNIEIYNLVNNLIFKGTFKYSKRNGPGIEYNPETGEIVYKCNYKDGYRDGLCEKYDRNGRLIAKTEYKKGKLHGKNITYHLFPGDDSGQMREHTIEYYKDGINDGPSKTWGWSNHASVCKYFLRTETNYKDGREEGFNIQYIIDKETLEHRKNFKISMVDGLYHGDYKSFDKDGNVNVSKWDMGKVVKT